MKIEKYLIVGTGPSVKDLTRRDFRGINKDVGIIAVNSSILFLPHADIWFTIDPSYRNLRYAKVAQGKSVPVVMALHNIDKNYGCKDLYRLKRKSREVPARLRNAYSCKTPSDWFLRWGCIPGFSEELGAVHTGNSLFSAMNLAFLDKPKKIGILGLDGSNKASVGGGHLPNNLSHLPLLFESTLPQLKAQKISVMNGSSGSTVSCYPKSGQRDLIEWLHE